MKQWSAKTWGRLAGGLLLASVAYSVIISLISHSVGGFGVSFFRVFWMTIVIWLIEILMAVGLLTDQIVLSRVSAIIYAVVGALSLAGIVILVFLDHSNLIDVTCSLLSFAGCALLAVALFLRGKQGSLFCLIATILLWLTSCVRYTMYMLMGYGVSFGDVLKNALVSALTLVYMIPLALYLERRTGPSPMKSAYAPVQMKSACAPAPAVRDPRSDIEKIAALKDLLDRGAITQEEFDAKKRQILGL